MGRALHRIEPFQWFQSFHRFAPFHSSNKHVETFTGSMFNVGGELPRSRIPEDEILDLRSQVRYKVSCWPPFYWVVRTVDALRSPGSDEVTA